MGNLKRRTVTALLLIPVIVLAITFLPVLSFAIISAFLLLAAASEWPNLIGKPGLFNITVYLTLVIIFMLISFFMVEADNRTGVIAVTYYLFIFFSWIFAFFWIFQYNKHGTTPVHNYWFYGYWGLWVIVPCWLGLNLVRNLAYGRGFILYLLLLVWSVDTTAYFAGKKWGQAKLIPRVSPNKTWAGFYGAMGACVALSFVGALIFPLSYMQKAAFIIVSIVTALFSIVGDLFISVLKRQHNLKDTGSLLPGHGGILDRIDSLTAAAPVFAMGLLLIGIK